MKNNAHFICLGFAFFVSTTFAQEQPMPIDLMPVPAKIEWREGKFRLNDAFKIAISGNPDRRLYTGATRALRRLAGRTGLFLPQDFLRPEGIVDSPNMTINCERPGQIQFGEDESYALTISSAQILLSARTDVGALRGL